jgi:hypothetical protein
MAPQSSALEECFNEVADSAPMALERCLNHVVSVLQEAESTSQRSAERIELGKAWRELLAHQDAWCKHYGDELRRAFHTPVASDADSPEQRGGSGRSRPQELTLVDDAEILEEIESSRLVRHVRPLVERPVSELDALMSSAMGLTSVRPELNPVRPEVFAQSLRALIGRSQVNASTGSLWLKYLAEPLSEELQNLYGRLVTQLKNANVQPADYRFTGTQSAARSPGSSADGHAAGAGRTAAAPSPRLSGHEISPALMRDFLVRGGGAEASQPLPSSYYAEVERELATLRSAAKAAAPAVARRALPSGYRELPVVERPPLPVDVQSTLSTSLWGDLAKSHERSLVRTKLRRDATRVAQVLGLELVRKVVNGIAQDGRLLAPVREAIVALEPSLLRLAMVDPRFFTDEQHPGRLLMERVAQRSFRYNDEFAEDFSAFFADVSREFNGLNRVPIRGSVPFEQALLRLQTAWDEVDRAEEQQRSDAVSAMRFAERRQAEASHIAWELSSRPDLENVPAVVQDFLFGRWALVLAHARLTDKAKQIDPCGYLSVIPDLLWSVKREVTLKQPAQLFERVPHLVATLRAGLASIGQGAEENEAFFHALMKLHHPVLKLRRAKSRHDARASGMAPLAAVDQAPAPPAPVAGAAADPVSVHPWMSPQELDVAGFEETLPTDMGELTGEPAVSAPAPLESHPRAPSGAAAQASRAAEPAPNGAMGVATLREGDWFDLYSKRRWRRAQLIWASSNATLFMFVSQGGRPHSMTKRVCERLIRDRYLRPVRMHGVVSHALDRLKQEPAA